ncbi:MAG: hypothetical protein IPK39_00955 [Sulfuritalea sp.]|nr:hypothetical protein [Sulfuritalea sp.]
MLRIRRKFGIRNAAIVVGEESLATTSKEVVDDLLPPAPDQRRCLQVDDARVMDICAQVASSAHWIISNNPAVQQLVGDNLGVLIPSVGDDAEVITKKTLVDAGIRPEWVPAVLALSDGKDAPLKRRQAVRLLEVYGSLEAAIADSSSMPTADWKRKLAPKSDALLQIEKGLRIRPAVVPAPATSHGGVFVEDSDASVTALKAYGFLSLVRMLPLPAASAIGVAASSEGTTTTVRFAALRT